MISPAHGLRVERNNPYGIGDDVELTLKQASKLLSISPVEIRRTLIEEGLPHRMVHHPKTARPLLLVKRGVLNTQWPKDRKRAA